MYTLHQSRNLRRPSRIIWFLVCFLLLIILTNGLRKARAATVFIPADPPDYLFSIPSQSPIHDAHDVAVDAAGNMYVVMGGALHLLVKLNPDGELIWFKDIILTIGDDYDSAGVAVDDSGIIYVVLSEYDRIYYFDAANGESLGAFGSRCWLDQSTPYIPAGTCVDPDGDGPMEEGDGQFMSPSGIAVDDEGFIYIVDRGNHRVQVFSAPGEFLFKFGSPCNLSAIDERCVDPDGVGRRLLGDGQFWLPFDVAVDGNRRIIITDRGNNRIQIFDSSGELIRKIGKYQYPALNYPSDIAADSLGRIYVAAGNWLEPSNTLVFSENGTLEMEVNSPACCPPGYFDRISGLAINQATGELIYSDFDFSSLTVGVPSFSTDDISWSILGSYGFGFNHFVRPSSVAVDNRNGNVYVADRITDGQVFTSAGQYVKRFGEADRIKIDDNGRLYNQTSYGYIFVMDLDSGTHLFTVASTYSTDFDVGADGNIYVTVDDDGIFQNQVNVYDSSGNFESLIELEDVGYISPGAMVLDASLSRIYIADYDEVYVFNMNGELLFEFGTYALTTIYDMHQDNTGRIFIADRTRSGFSQVKVFSAEGEYLSRFGTSGIVIGPGYFDKLVGVHVDDQYRVYVVDEDNWNVHVFSYPPADLSLDLSAPASADGGGSFVYDIGVYNAGPRDAKDVVITDELPVRLSYLSSYTTIGHCVEENGHITCYTEVSFDACSVEIRTVTCQLGDLTPTSLSK